MGDSRNHIVDGYTLTDPTAVLRDSRGRQAQARLPGEFRAITATPFLKTLLQPISPEKFAAEYLEKNFLYLPKIKYRRHLQQLSIDRFGQWLMRNVPSSQVRVFDADQNEIAADNIKDSWTERFFSRRHSLVLNWVNQIDSEVGNLAHRFEEALQCAVSVNAYLTPAGAQTLKKHWDNHDVIILQIAGEKNWQVFGAAAELPLRSEENGRLRAPVGARGPRREKKKAPFLTLRPGSLLYIPRGFTHVASATDQDSLHLTFGLHPVLGIQVLESMVKDALQICEDELYLRQGLSTDLTRKVEPMNSLTERLRQTFLSAFQNVSGPEHIAKTTANIHRLHLQEKEGLWRQQGRNINAQTRLRFCKRAVLAPAHSTKSFFEILIGQKKILVPKQVFANFDGLVANRVFYVRDMYDARKKNAAKEGLLKQLIHNGVLEIVGGS